MLHGISLNDLVLSRLISLRNQSEWNKQELSLLIGLALSTLNCHHDNGPIGYQLSIRLFQSKYYTYLNCVTKECAGFDREAATVETIRRHCTNGNVSSRSNWTSERRQPLPLTCSITTQNTFSGPWSTTSASPPPASNTSSSSSLCGIANSFINSTRISLLLCSMPIFFFITCNKLTEALRNL